jgi:hypothetical protein
VLLVNLTHLGVTLPVEIIYMTVDATAVWPFCQWLCLAERPLAFWKAPVAYTCKWIVLNHFQAGKSLLCFYRSYVGDNTRRTTQTLPPLGAYCVLLGCTYDCSNNCETITFCDWNGRKGRITDLFSSQDTEGGFHRQNLSYMNSTESGKT